jgi:hypothetical protein
VIFHLCWRQLLLFDLNAPLRESTVLHATATPEEVQR